MEGWRTQELIEEQTSHDSGRTPTRYSLDGDLCLLLCSQAPPHQLPLPWLSVGSLHRRNIPCSRFSLFLSFSLQALGCWQSFEYVAEAAPHCIDSTFDGIQLKPSSLSLTFPFSKSACGNSVSCSKVNFDLRLCTRQKNSFCVLGPSSCRRFRKCKNEASIWFIKK